MLEPTVRQQIEKSTSVNSKLVMTQWSYLSFSLNKAKAYLFTLIPFKIDLLTSSIAGQYDLINNPIQGRAHSPYK